MKLLQSVVFFVLIFSFQKEGQCTHLETCSCHDIQDIVNATVQEALRSGEYVSGNNQLTETSIERILNSKVQELTDTIKSLLKPMQASLEHHLPVPKNGKDNPAASCHELKQLNVPSGYYWVKAGHKSDSPAVRVYCNMSFTCGDITGGWMKVADLDMRNASQTCPSGFTLLTSPKRLCNGRSSTCVGTSYATHDIQYSHVCGRIVGYQNRVPIAYHYNYNGIDQRYVFGISLTHGPPSNRSHIWTFTGASDETAKTHSPSFKCPCINTNIQTGISIPNFIGNDYFCDTALSVHYDSVPRALQLDDPLWDGKGCGPSNACCNFPNSKVKPPWFYKNLSSKTTDNIEMRLCQPKSDGSTPIEIVELYVQ